MIQVLHLLLATVFIRSIHDFFSSFNEDHKLKNLLAKVEKVLTFLSLAFFNLEQTILCKL